MVNRYDFDWRNTNERSCMSVAADGEYVKHRDYAALEAENAKLKAVVERQKSEMLSVVEVSVKNERIVRQLPTQNTAVTASLIDTVSEEVGYFPPAWDMV